MIVLVVDSPLAVPVAQTRVVRFWYEVSTDRSGSESR
jgi:hypothetical protein